MLPTGVVPITTVPTVLRHGEIRRARVRFQGGSWTDVAPEELTEYVSEEHNPENTKRVAAVEVFVPSALLADGMCFVDTPGLGSVFAANSAATHAFVPHIDAAIIVIGADPPIAGEELTLVEEVGKRVQQLLVVRHRPDRIILGEIRGGEAYDLLQLFNTGHAGSLSTVHATSARQALARFTSCVLQSGVDLPYRAIKANIGQSVNVVLQLERRPGRRFVSEVLQINGFDADVDKYDSATIFAREKEPA